MARPTMPSFDHEALLELLRRRPTLAPELLRDALHVPMPPDEHVEVGDSTLTELSPTERKADIARATFAAMRGLNEERTALYNDIALLSLRAAARAIFEDLMANGTYQYKSDFAKRYVAQGERTGEARGRAEGRAFAILAVLSARGVDASSAVRERVLACTDVTLRDGWIARAANGKEAGEVVGE